MLDEITSEVKRIAKNKRLKNSLVLIYIYLIRILIAFIPVVLLSIIKFIFGIFALVNLNFISYGFNIIYEICMILISYLAFIATSPFLFGGLNYFNNEAKGETKDEKLTKYIHDSKFAFKQMKLMLVLSLGFIISSCLLIIPGIIFACFYILSPYVLLDNKDLSIKEAMKESRRIIKGRMMTLVLAVLKINLPWLLIYIIGTYFKFMPHFMALGNLLLFVGFFVMLCNVSDTFLALSVLYQKVSGKKAGAIDVEYREIKD